MLAVGELPTSTNPPTPPPQKRLPGKNVAVAPLISQAAQATLAPVKAAGVVAKVHTLGATAMSAAAATATSPLAAAANAADTGETTDARFAPAPLSAKAAAAGAAVPPSGLFVPKCAHCARGFKKVVSNSFRLLDCAADRPELEMPSDILVAVQVDEIVHPPNNDQLSRMYFVPNTRKVVLTLDDSLYKLAVGKYHRGWWCEKDRFMVMSVLTSNQSKQSCRKCTVWKVSGTYKHGWELGAVVVLSCMFARSCIQILH